MPRFSVIIPTYNRVEELGEAVASVAAQTLPDWECLVVDDGSTDQTPAFAERLCSQDKRIRYLRLSNGGMPGRTRNAGIRSATAPFLAFLDDDDVWTHDKLERQARVFERHPKVNLSFGQIAKFGREQGLWPDRRLPQKPSFEALFRGNFIPCSTAVVRTEIVRELGGFSETMRFAEDYDLWLRIAHPQSSELHAMREVLCHYRVHDRSICRNFDGEEQVLRELRARIQATLGPRDQRRQNALRSLVTSIRDRLF